jgi:hypothetical protein
VNGKITLPLGASMLLSISLYAQQNSLDVIPENMSFNISYGTLTASYAPQHQDKKCLKKKLCQVM